MAKSANQRVASGVWTLGWISFLSDVAADMIYPLLPDFLTRTLHAGPAALGLIEGVAESTASLMKVVSGWWSDHARRRKPLVVAGYSIAAAARPLIGVASSWTQVLLIRFADRVGKGIRTSPRDALLADMVPPGERGKAYGLQRAMDNAGAVGGPLLAAFLLRFVFEDERSVFLLAAIPGALAVALLVAKVRDAPGTSGAEPSRAGSGAALPRRFWAALAVFVVFALATSTDAFLILKAGDTGVPMWQIPLLWAAFNGVKAAFGVPGGALADRLGQVWTILAGWTIYALAYVGFAFVSSPAQIWGLFAFYALFYALTEGAERALVADLVPAASRGRAFGAFHASVGLAALPASVLFGIFWKSLGPKTAFLIGAALAIVAAGGLLAWKIAFGRSLRTA
ncbi:MAG TPA: MFS transporter [Thermoanaerobaculia bacterium]|nr:MFS transporter [Thermoanaerobaculia bacterium]